MDSQLGELARRIAAARDHEAEEELCRRLVPRLRVFVTRYRRDAQAADDLAHDTVLVVLSALRSGRLQDPARVPAFALATCRSLMISGRRTSRRHEELLARTAPGASTPPPDDGPLDRRRLAECMSKLADRERRVIELTFWEEETAEEIAASLGTSPGNVRVIRHRALERLHECVSRGEGVQ
jgi:RNA polymerase sigma-70 factor (ECF subfamily)